jgi:hypothetical protein
MKSKKITIAFICALSLLSSVAFAQDWHTQDPEGGVVHLRVGGGPGWIGPQEEGTFAFVSAEGSIDGKVVKGAPFSAQTVSEHIQVLADGNRIVNTNTGAIYRDSEGRTRREQQIAALGGFAAEKAPAEMISIHDPVAGTNFALNPSNKTATKHGAFKIQLRHQGDSSATASAGAIGSGVVITTAEGDSNVAVRRTGPLAPVGERMKVQMEAKTESLGKQTIEGVEAEGTRTTRTIPAGAMGNEQPINIVFERWYSPELQTVVMTRHSDPRFGESTFRLTNINRTEPAAALFQVPSDYTVNEPGTMMRQMRRPREQ